MATLADSLVSSTARKIPLRMRPDLIVRRQVLLGQRCFAVKEPLGPAYFRFREEEFALLQLLDGRSSLDDIKQRAERLYPNRNFTHEQIWQFLGSLHRGNLVISDSPQQGAELKKRRDERKRKELLGKIANVLAIRFRGFDPERLLNGLYPLVRWMFSPAAVALVSGLALSALLLVAVQFDVFVSRLPDFHQFFGLGSIGTLVLALAISKILHEFGHGLSCKHFGGECHEIGVLVLVLTPCLYCNVSDSWMLRSKWQRAAIGAAGMYVEVVLASLCTFLWWFSEPGLLNHLCLYIMFVCSVSTIVFNGNPLLRYDGYYILSDLIEIPNLRQKTDAVLQRTLAWWCLGLEPPRDRYLPPRRRVLFIVYGIAAAVYRWFVLALILWFLTKVFEQHRLAIIGQMIAAVAIIGLVAVPVYKFGKLIWVPGRWENVKKTRLMVSGCVAAVLLGIVLFLPLPHHVMCPLEIKARGATPVYVEVAGKLRELDVRAGQAVEAGARLALLESLNLAMEIEQLSHQRDQYAAQLKTLGRQRFRDLQALAQMPQVKESLVSTEEQLAQRLADRNRLVLTAPCAGTVLPPPLVPDKPARDGRLPAWSGTPLEEKNLGCHLENKVLFCQIGDPRKLEAVLVVDQADIEFVQEGLTVEMKLDELPDAEFPGTVVSVAQMQMQATPAALSAKTGGELATHSDESGVERPQSASYQARVLLDDNAGLLRLGLRGRAKVHTVPQTLGQRAWRYFSLTFRFSH
jgi:putative peptide zinc metalloprotease protein